MFEIPKMKKAVPTPPILSNLINVQPMTAPTGTVYTLRFISGSYFTYIIRHINTGAGRDLIIFDKKKNDKILESYTLKKNTSTNKAFCVQIFEGNDVEKVREFWNDYIETGYEPLDVTKERVKHG
jgi:hypothetical protein